LLAIDLNTCTRCTGTLDNIEKAIETIRPTLEVMSVPVNVRKIIIQSEEEALEHQFSVSPTIRINGHDISFETTENRCNACTDLSGHEEGTDCRIWPYQGKEYTEAPVGLVVESILGIIFGNHPVTGSTTPEYNGVPENLRRFFQGISSVDSCCTPQEQESCCEPGEKAACCESAEPVTCGCQ